MPTNYNLTTTPVDITLADGDTVTATDGTIVPGDQLTGVDNTTLILDGSGTFDLTAPATDGGFVKGIPVIEESGSGQNVTLVAGMPVTVTVDSGNSNESVTLADPGDTYEGGDSFNNTITVDAALLSAVTIDGGSGGGNTLALTGSDTTVDPSSSNLFNFQSLELQGPGLTIDAPSISLDGIYFYNSGDTVTLDSSAPNAIDYDGGNTVVFTGSNQTLYADESPGTDGGVQDTLVGFDSTDTSDSILMQLLSTPDTVTTTLVGTNTMVQVTGTDSGGNAQQYSFEFKGDYSSTGDFNLTPQGSGFALTYDQTPTTTAILTTGTDVVGPGVTQVIATDGTLTAGDQINPDPGATLDLVGGGTFDLTQPGDQSGGGITNIGAITVESTGANVTLLDGLAPVTLSAAGDDTVTLPADQIADIDANGGSGDTFNVDAFNAEYATIVGGPFSTLNIDTLTQGGGQAITLSPNITGIRYASLFGGADSFDPGANGPALVYVQDIDFTGNNTIELTGNTNAAIDYGTGGQPDNFFFDPASETTQVVTIAYEDAPTENLYGFDSYSEAVLSAFDYSKGTPTLTVASDTTVAGAPGTGLIISGTDSSGHSITQTLQLFGDDYNPAAFTISQVSGGTGALITYSGTTTYTPTNTLSTSSAENITSVSDVYAAADQFDVDGNTIATTPNGTLHLVGPGDFKLNNSTISGVTTIDGESGHQNITLGSPTGPVTVDLAPEGNDALYNVTNDTTIEGGTSGNNAAATAPGYVNVNDLHVDLGSGGGNYLTISNQQDQSYSLTLNAPGIADVDTFAIDDDDAISIDTGDYQATTGIPVSIDIADNLGSTLGGDRVTLEGNGESAQDFYGGNFFTLRGPNETFNDYRYGTNVNNVETISGFDQGASTNDTISVWFADTVGTDIIPATNPATEHVAKSEDPTGDSGIGTTTLTLTGTESGDPYTSQIVLDGLYGGTFVATKNAAWDITYTACYRRGTRILTERGESAIETLKIGDRVATRNGALRPIRWIGRRRYSGSVAWGNRDVLPIRFRAGSLGEGLPRRDLWVSPEHAMYVDGMLIPATALVNGTSIVQETQVEEVTYLHLELDSHDVIRAEGAWSESFVDDDSRSLFDNAADYAALYPDAVAEPARFCAPRVEEGEALEAVRRRLARLAEAADDAFTVAPAAIHSRTSGASIYIEGHL